MIDQSLKDSFKLLNGLPYYIGLEELEDNDINLTEIESKLKDFINNAQEWGCKRISALIIKTTNHYSNLSETLLNLGFEKYASRVEVYLDLEELDSKPPVYEWRHVDFEYLTEEKFKRVWERCMIGSDNKASSIAIDEHLHSVKSELGPEWRHCCKVVFKNNSPIGMAIPHIEPGTEKEGRLFYFGLIPEARGKGMSSHVHLQSLQFLKEMGATYYIGSTHESNIKMQKVFSRNSCTIKSRTESYYKYF